MDDNRVRNEVVKLLKGGQAHAGLDRVLDGLKPENRNKKPHPDLHTVWQELEHIRIAQEDILNYTKDQSWKSPSWPDEYWPDENEDVAGENWQISVDKVFSDLDELINIAEDDNTDLSAELPEGEGRTYLRQLLLAADHMSYHMSKIVDIRKMLNNW